MVELYRRRWEHYGHGPADQAIVGLGGQVFMRENSQDAIREFRPYFDHAPVYGGGPSLEDYMDQTPLTVGSPQQVIDRTLGFRDFVGDYQRQLFLLDHAGLPLTVSSSWRCSASWSCRSCAASSRLGPPHVPGRAGPSARGRRGAARLRPPSRRPRAVDRSAAAGEPRARSLVVVVSAGLSQPSSTRLLADRLAAATERHLARRRHRADRPGHRAARSRPGPRRTTC